MLFGLIGNLYNSHFMASLNINDILSQVKQLDKEDQLTLLQRIASLLKRTQTTKPTSSAQLTHLPAWEAKSGKVLMI
jgi:hypothetical protein